jgi:hypothetical protein
MSLRASACATCMLLSDLCHSPFIPKALPLRSSTQFLMDTLTTFGLFAVTAMMTCYALENRSRLYVLGFAGACVLGSIYGFLQGAWPFGVVEAIWSFIALRRFWQGKSN